MADQLEDKILELVKKLDEEKRLGDKRAKQLYDLVAGVGDEKVAIDAEATPGYLGASGSDGVLRIGEGLTYVDGGDYITIGAETMYTTNPMKQYPVLAAAVSLTSSATAWNWGTTVEIVPASTITSTFIVVGVYVQANSTVTVDWQLQLMHGSGDTELMTVSGASETDTSSDSGMIFLPLFIKVPANDRIRAKATDSSASAKGYAVRICYIEV